MVTVDKISKIYIYCPARRVTGGTELAHQLADYLTCNGIDAYIVYYEKDKIVSEKIPVEFQNYNIRISINVIDDYKNIVILPEVVFGISKMFQKSQFIFWWMSVDNFYSKAPLLSYAFFFKPYNALKLIYNRISNGENIFTGFSLSSLKKIKNNNLHVYQSTYAKYFLIKNSFIDILPLSDFINSNYFSKKNENQIKENIILYNRSKGYHLTKKIIKRLPEFTFIPLINCTREQLSALFSKSKIYIDFGNHPGKDRMPREAALNNCCIIVGKNGAANFFEDIPILDKYKICNRHISEITRTIKHCIHNYESVINDFDFYKRRILTEKRKFYLEIDEIFNIYNANSQ